MDYYKRHTKEFLVIYLSNYHKEPKTMYVRRPKRVLQGHYNRLTNKFFNERRKESEV